MTRDVDTRQGRGILPHQHGDYIVRLKRPTWSCENIRKKKTISCKSRHYPLPVRLGCVLPVCCLRSAAVSVLIEGLLLCAVYLMFNVYNAAMSERFNMKSCQNSDTRRTAQHSPGTAQLCKRQSSLLLIILFVGLQHAELFNSPPGLGQF